MRDADVSIEALESLHSEAPEQYREGLEQISAQRKLRRDSFRAALHGAISLEARERSQMIFNQALAKWPTAKPSQTASLKEVGRAVIVERAQDVRRLSNSFYQPFEIEPLHRLRIMAKRLRYAIELFAACWPEQLEDAAGSVSRLQAELGDLHDCDEWIAGFSRELRQRQDFSDAWGQTAQWLLASFVKKRGKSYAAALLIWQQW